MFHVTIIGYFVDAHIHGIMYSVGSDAINRVVTNKTARFETFRINLRPYPGPHLTRRGAGVDPGSEKILESSDLIVMIFSWG